MAGPTGTEAARTAVLGVPGFACYARLRPAVRYRGRPASFREHGFGRQAQLAPIVPCFATDWPFVPNQRMPFRHGVVAAAYGFPGPPYGSPANSVGGGMKTDFESY